MSVNERITKLEAENVELRKENTVILDLKTERRDAKLKARIEELEKNKADSSAENVRHDEEVAELKAELRNDQYNKTTFLPSCLRDQKLLE
ncbi:3813_t:CDS:2, partial [Rhizophagus irregularis]